MKLFDLFKIADQKIQQSDVSFNEKTEVVLGIIRALGIVPHKRIVERGYLHKLLAGAFVVANQSGETIDITTRQFQQYVDAGVSTQVVKWLDRACEENLLLTESPEQKADGVLRLGELLTWHIDSFQNSSSASQSV